MEKVNHEESEILDTQAIEISKNSPGDILQ